MTSNAKDATQQNWWFLQQKYVQCFLKTGTWSGQHRTSRTVCYGPDCAHCVIVRWTIIISQLLPYTTRVLTDINDLGKVGCPRTVSGCALDRCSGNSTFPRSFMSVNALARAITQANRQWPKSCKFICNGSGRYLTLTRWKHESQSLANSVLGCLTQAYWFAKRTFCMIKNSNYFVLLNMKAVALCIGGT